MSLKRLRLVLKIEKEGGSFGHLHGSRRTYFHRFRILTSGLIFGGQRSLQSSETWVKMGPRNGVGTLKNMT